MNYITMDRFCEHSKLPQDQFDHAALDDTSAVSRIAPSLDEVCSPRESGIAYSGNMLPNILARMSKLLPQTNVLHHRRLGMSLDRTYLFEHESVWIRLDVIVEPDLLECSPVAHFNHGLLQVMTRPDGNLRDHIVIREEQLTLSSTRGRS
jgi:hypothetical protein